jgi:predicted nucleic acid-binding protein
LFANRYTALIDACSLAGALKRNLLLTLAEGEFFRVRWSAQILDETQNAIEKILTRKGAKDASECASRARRSMEEAFEEACVSDFEEFLPACSNLPDQKDAHVMAAAMKTQASVIVTENLKHFPEPLLAQLNIDVRSADAFIADTVDLDPGRAVAAVRKMRERMKKPSMTAEALLLAMEAEGLIETADLLRPHVESL